MEQRIRPNARCHRCPSPDTVRLRKIRRTDNHVFRCVRCGFLFSPPTPATPSVRPEVEEPAPCPTRGHAPQLRDETREPKLDSYANAAIETTSSYEKTIFSYDSGRTLAD